MLGQMLNTNPDDDDQMSSLQWNPYSSVRTRAAQPAAVVFAASRGCSKAPQHDGLRYSEHSRIASVLQLPSSEVAKALYSKLELLVHPGIVAMQLPSSVSADVL